MTSRVRCSCGRVYDPVKHTTCPECGAESAVESVVVAEKVKPPVPPDLNRELTQNGGAGATGTTGGREGQAQRVRFLKGTAWPIYAGAAAFILVILFLLLRPHPAEQLVKKGDERSPQVPQEASPTPAISISPSAAPTIPAGTPQDVSPTPASSAGPSFAPDGLSIGFQSHRGVGDQRPLAAQLRPDTNSPLDNRNRRTFHLFRTLVRRGNDHRIERQDEMVLQQRRSAGGPHLPVQWRIAYYTRAAWRRTLVAA